MPFYGMGLSVKNDCIRCEKSHKSGPRPARELQNCCQYWKHAVYSVWKCDETLYVVVLIFIFVRIMCATYQRRTVVKGRGT